MSKLSFDQFSKDALIENLLDKRVSELNNVTGGKAACVMGCSGEPIGCGPGYCVGPCPAGCLSECMAAPSCSNQNP